MGKVLAAALLPLVLTACSGGECEENTMVQLQDKNSKTYENSDQDSNKPIIGYWAYSWSVYQYGPKNQTVGICFGGYQSAEDCLTYCLPVASKICSGSTVPCTKWLSIGGGTVTMDESVLTDTVGLAASISQAGFEGIIFDAENIVQEPGTDMVVAFQKTTAALKAANFSVGITTSHSAPISCSGCVAGDLVLGWVADPNIDILSPQLYSGGSTLELVPTASCQDDTPACTWNLWENSTAPIVPSIPYADNFDKAQDYFLANYSITFGGYIQWMPSYNGVTTYWCGYTFDDAAENCYKECPSTTAADCDEGQYCWQPITTCGTTTAVPGPDTKPPSPSMPRRGSPPRSFGSLDR